MPQDEPVLLLTRPEPASRRFLQELEKAAGSDLAAVISPLMQTRFFDAGLPDAAEIVFTSEMAVFAVARLTASRSARAWCVGGRTEAAARAAGFRTVTGPGTAAGLAAALAKCRPGRQVFCPRARQQSFDMAAALKLAGIDTISVTVYEQVPDRPTAEALASLNRSAPVLLPLFSRRSAHLACAAFPDHRAPLLIAALSDQVAAAAECLNPARIAVAKTPASAAMVDVVLKLLRGDEAG